MSKPLLKPVPYDDWQDDFDTLMRDTYLSQKYSREVRLDEHLDYIRRHCHEVTQKLPGVVVDVGPGPGEFLEWCRHYGNRIYAVDSPPDGLGGMGSGYVKLSRLMLDRQEIPRTGEGWLRFVDQLPAIPSMPKELTPGVSLFNFRGSWAQCFAHLVSGPPHHLHHNVQQQRWKWGRQQREEWVDAFEAMVGALLPGGHILIAANRLGEPSEWEIYVREIKAVAEACGLTLVHEYDGYVHKWRRKVAD